MAKRLDHARAHKKERVKKESKGKEAPTPLHWSQMTRGKKKGLTAPEAMIDDPGYIFWAYAKGKRRFNGVPRREADIVCHRAKHILPPYDGTEFVLDFDQSGKLTRIRLGPISHRYRKSQVRHRHLDLSIAGSLFLRYDRAGVALFREFVVKTYFRNSTSSFSRRTELFFENESNFDISCGANHVLPAMERRVKNASSEFPGSAEEAY
jgi:hypothetical protein